MLDNENAKILEKRVLDRLKADGENAAVASLIREVAVRTAIITIQEYERMQSESQDQ